MRVTAAVVPDAGRPYELQELELEPPRHDEVVVRVAAVGLCHTDTTFASGRRDISFPAVLGHEGAGVVEAVGESVRDFAAGDRVLMSFASCDRCSFCASGQPGYCRNMWQENMSGRRADGTTPLRRLSDGVAVSGNFFGQSSFATHAVCRARSLVPLDPDVPFEIAAPLGCGFQTGAGAVLNVLKPGPGGSLAVFGGGAVGLSAMLAAKASGVAHIAVIEPHERRRKLAVALGASAAFSPAESELIEKLRDVTGNGFATALDTTGSPDVIATAFAALDQGGAVALVAAGPTRDSCLSIPLASIIPGRRIQGVVEGNSNPRHFIPQLLRMWRAGSFPIERLCETFEFHRFGDGVDAAQRGDVIKPVFSMSI